MRAIDITGQKFSRLTVVRRVENSVSNQIRFECLCDCGKTTIAFSGAIRTGHTQSCGCLLLESRASGSAATHRKSGTQEYRAWAGMRKRCLNKKSKDYPYYGGRGITICSRWDLFENFIADMGESNGKTLERNGVDGNYEPSNCRWATRQEQSRNRRTSRLLTFNGETRCMSEWAEIIGISRDALKFRLHRGWSVDKALTQGATS